MGKEKTVWYVNYAVETSRTKQGIDVVDAVVKGRDVRQPGTTFLDVQLMNLPEEIAREKARLYEEIQAPLPLDPAERDVLRGKKDEYGGIRSEETVTLHAPPTSGLEIGQIYEKIPSGPGISIIPEKEK